MAMQERKKEMEEPLIFLRGCQLVTIRRVSQIMALRERGRVSFGSWNKGDGDSKKFRNFENMVEVISGSSSLRDN